MTMRSNDLSSQLQEMLCLDTSSVDKSVVSSAQRPVIEIVDDESPCPVNDASSDDDEPPPISFHNKPTTKQQRDKSNNSSNQTESELSLAEIMMNHAAAALEAKSKEKEKKRQKNVGKATYGVKKGFLNSSSESTMEKSQSKRSKATAQKQNKSALKSQDNNLIYELDSQGNMIPIQQQTSSDQSILQEAQNITSHLSNNIEWVTPDLLETISKHPKLAAGMNNPRFTLALQQMQSNPKETLAKLQRDDPEVLQFIHEFCGAMGNHFSRLSEEQGIAAKDVTESKTNGKSKVREMGVLEENAMRKHKAHHSATATQISNEQIDNATDEQVSAILSNNELRTILLDAKMQQIIEECSTQVGKLGYFMRHDEYGPKLRKLMEAGLLRVA